LSPERFAEIVNLARKYQTAARSIQVTSMTGTSLISALHYQSSGAGCKALFFVSSKAIGGPDFKDAADIVSSA